MVKQGFDIQTLQKQDGKVNSMILNEIGIWLHY